MNKKTLLILSAVAMALPITACNSQTIEGSVHEQSMPSADMHREEGYSAVTAIIDAYKSNFPGQLEALVSNDYVPSKQEFVNSLEQSAIDKTIINIEISVNTAILKGDKMAVDFHWDRTYMPKGSATQTMDSGTTNFVFVKEEEQWHLLQVSGEDIF